jgi:hypothetical protein
VADPSDLLALSEPVRARLRDRHDAREIGLAASRDAIRAAANAIRAIHRGEVEQADTLIGDARQALSTATDACAPHPSVLHAGFVTDAAKEVAEAVLTRSACDGCSGCWRVRTFPASSGPDSWVLRRRGSHPPMSPDCHWSAFVRPTGADRRGCWSTGRDDAARRWRWSGRGRPRVDHRLRARRVPRWPPLDRRLPRDVLRAAAARAEPPLAGGVNGAT